MIGEREKKLVDYWERQLREGVNYRSRSLPKEKVERYYKYYRADWDDFVVPVNKVFSYGRSMVPRVYFRNPAVTVVPRRPEYEAAARVVEAVDNWIIGEVGLKYTLKRAILHAYLAGVGPIKLGFDSEFGFIPDQAALPDSETLTQVGRTEEGKIEYNVNVKPGMPWALDVHPCDIIVPWGYVTPESLPWIAHVVARPLEDVKQDQKYRNTKDLKGGFRPMREGQPRMFSPGGTDYTLLYEIRDVKRRRLVVLCEGRCLMDEEDSLQIEGLPYEFVVFNPDPESFWGIPDVKVVEAQQRELNDIRTQASKQRRLALLKFLYQKGSITKENLEKLLSEEGTVAVEVNDLPGTAVSIMQPHVPPDLWREAETVSADFREVLGYSRNQAGEFVAPVTPRTATEVMAVREAMEIRAEERRDIVADVLTNIVRKFNQYIFTFWTSERVTKIVGRDGAQHWVKFTGEQIRGEYDILVHPDMGLPVTRGTRFQQALQLFQLLRDDPFIDQLVLREKLLHQIAWVDPSWPLVVRPPEPGPFPGTGAEVGEVPTPPPPRDVEELIERGVL